MMLPVLRERPDRITPGYPTHKKLDGFVFETIQNVADTRGRGELSAPNSCDE